MQKILGNAEAGNNWEIKYKMQRVSNCAGGRFDSKHSATERILYASRDASLQVAIRKFEVDARHIYQEVGLRNESMFRP